MADISDVSALRIIAGNQRSRHPRHQVGLSFVLVLVRVIVIVVDCRFSRRAAESRRRREEHPQIAQIAQILFIGLSRPRCALPGGETAALCREQVWSQTRTGDWRRLFFRAGWWTLGFSGGFVGGGGFFYTVVVFMQLFDLLDGQAGVFAYFLDG